MAFDTLGMCAILLPAPRNGRFHPPGKRPFRFPRPLHIDICQYVPHLCYNIHMTYWIATTNDERRAEWRRSLGMDRLPVTTPRAMMIRRGAWKRPYFMLDAKALTVSQRLRLVGRVWCGHVHYETAVRMVDDGVLIDGRDCEVVEPVDDHPLASLFAYAA